MVKLNSGDWTLILAPEFGGCVRACEWRGHDILRPAVTDMPAIPAVGMSAFPMLPYIGRIASGTFTFDGKSISLPHNMPPESHAIHGEGWQAAWTVGDQSATRICLQQSHMGEAGWPWPYEAQQTFAIEDDTLRLSFDLTNQGQTSMPAGFGWHPYFPRKGAMIAAGIETVWLSDTGSLIGDAPSPLPDDLNFRTKRAIADLTLDHCFTGGAQDTRLTWPETGLSVHITSDDIFKFLTVFVPQGEDYFCVEPITHVPNAVNSALASDMTGFRVLAPGERLTGDICLHVSETPSAN